MKLFFDHIAKTAGASLATFFSEAFGEDCVSPCNVHHDLHSFLKLYNDRTVVSGHFHFTPGDVLPEDYVRLTVLRDPRERTLSQFFYSVEDMPETSLSALERDLKKFSLKQVLYDDTYKSMCYNTQAMHFASLYKQSLWDISNKELLDLAKKGLDQYDLVGTTERLSELVDHLKTTFNIPDSVVLKRKNTTSQRKKFADLPLALRSRIHKQNQVDLVLWRHAGRLFDTRTKFFTLPSPPPAAQPKRIPPEPRQQPTRQKPDTPPPIELLRTTIQTLRNSFNVLLSGEFAQLELAFRTHQDIDNLNIGYKIIHSSGFLVFAFHMNLLGTTMQCRAGADYFARFLFPVLLGPGDYTVTVLAYAGPSHLDQCYFYKQDAVSFTVEGFLGGSFAGLVRLMPSCSYGITGASGSIGVTTAHAGNLPTQHLTTETPIVTNTLGSIQSLSHIEPLRTGVDVALRVRIANNSAMDWEGEGDKPVHIAYHWFDGDGEIVDFEGIRTPLPGRAILAGTTVETDAALKTPKLAGTYILELTLVQEHVLWFEQHQFRSAKCTVSILDSTPTA